MKKIYATFCLFLGMFSLNHTLLASMESAQADALLHKVNSLGFSGILKDLANENHLRAVVDCLLKKILAYYSIQSENVAREEYQRALDALHYYMANQVLGMSIYAGPHIGNIEEDAQRIFGSLFENDALNVTLLQPAHVLFNLIVDNEANLEQTGEGLRTPLHFAAAENKPLFVRKLLEKGANPDAVGPVGMAPLHFAVASGNRYIVELLLEAGAFLDCVTGSGATILGIATNAYNPIMMSYILGLGVNVSTVEQDVIARRLPDVEFRRLLQEQEDQVVEKLSEYSQENQIDLPVDLARMITTFVVSRLEERSEDADDSQAQPPLSE